MADLKAPAGIDDFSGAGEEALRAAFREVWNDSRGGFLGAYVAARSNAPNYVDPRTQPPVTEPVPVPWNGFPKAMSRWHGDEESPAERQAAEESADVLVQKLYFVHPSPQDPQSLTVFSCGVHQLPFYAARLGAVVADLARPRRMLTAGGAIGAEVKELYRQQDEYLEWHAERDGRGRLVGLTFTAEPPDYWTALAAISKAKVVELYRTLVSPEVTEADLFFEEDLVAFGIDTEGQEGWFIVGGKGEYNPLNRWTTTDGIVHLTHPANTLGAEVTLARDASRAVRADALPPPTPGDPSTEVRRIACGGYGGINRSSDPLIGLAVGDLINAGNRITLTDPVGLYIARCDLASLRGPQGELLGESAKTILRGVDDSMEPRILRLRVAVPSGQPFVIGECSFDGRPLQRGGQIARSTTMALYAQVYVGGATSDALECDGRVCRHPGHENFFTSTAPDRACPDANDPIWHLEAPLTAPVAVPRRAFAAVATSAPVVGVRVATSARATRARPKL